MIDIPARFPEVECVRSTKASASIPKLDDIFAVHDRCHPFWQWSSTIQWERLQTVFGGTWNQSTVLHNLSPQGNGRVDIFMQPL